MFEFFEKLFSSEFMPHGHCYMWAPDILWLHVISDAIITISYYSIPFALIYLVKKRSELAFGWIFLLFGGFILLCGTTHLLEIWAVWNGTYRLTGIVKMITAVFSIFTAVLLWPAIPKILAIPKTEDLKALNQQLQEEIEERILIEIELKNHREHLEVLITSRTEELENINARLRKEVIYREKAEQEIKRSEDRYHVLFDKYHDLYEYAPDMYASVDVTSQLISECNLTLAEELGIPKSEIIGRPMSELYNKDCLGEVERAFNTFIETGRVRNAELQLQRPGGSQIDVMLNISAVRDPQNNIVASRLSWRDVTALKMAHQAVQDSVSRISAIVDTAVDAILTIDKKGAVESFNPAAERIFGYKAEEVIGKNVHLLMPAFREEHNQYLHNYLSTGDKKVIGIGREVEGRHKNGAVFPLELSVSEFEIKGDRRFTGIIRDITERKHLERIKDEFVSIVSHELRTPLTSINGSLGAIAAGTVGEVSPLALKMVSIAQRNCERLVRLINDLLDIQKMEAGKYEIASMQIDLISLMERAIESNIGFAREHKVDLELKAEDDALWIDGDEDRLFQVMTNLLSNAAKFSPALQMVTVQVDKLKDRVRVCVIDRGEGIPEEYRGRIFQKFTQAEASMRRTNSGTGLGLSISKGIVELHGGHIGFESEPGKGTTFFFELPVMQEVCPV